MAIKANQTESLYLPDLAEITRAEKLTELEKCFGLKLKNGNELGHKPGQFVMVSVFGIGTCF